MSSTDGRPTLAAIAASAGVSVATVSKVVNGRHDVGPQTRARVEALLRQHSYVARRAETNARQRSGGRPSIELVFDGRLNAYGAELIQGVLDTATEADVSIALSMRGRRSGRSDRGAAAWARELADDGRRAVIAVVNDLTAADIKALARVRLPLVVIDPLDQPQAPVTSVGSTNFAGGLAATQHLLGLGHRRIAYVGGPVTAGCNRARMHGYRAAMEAEEVPVLPGYLRTGRFLYEDGEREGLALLDLPEPPTAVFAASDETAAGVLEAARSHGLRIPAELSVVGFDDTQVAQLVSPQLTTVRQPLPEMGAVALRTALRLAAGEKLESHHVELATQLVIRESTAPPRGSADEHRQAPPGP